MECKLRWFSAVSLSQWYLYMYDSKWIFELGVLDTHLESPHTNKNNETKLNCLKIIFFI